MIGRTIAGGRAAAHDSGGDAAGIPDGGSGFRSADSAGVRSHATRSWPAFGYDGIARLKPGVSIARPNADVSRLVAVWMDSWSNGPGTNPPLLRELEDHAELQPAEAAGDRQCGQCAVGGDGDRRAGDADCLRQSLRICCWCGRTRGSRSCRFAQRWGRDGRGLRANCCWRAWCWACWAERWRLAWLWRAAAAGGHGAGEFAAAERGFA